MTGKRLLGLVVVALLVVALTLWGAAQGRWVTATWADPLRGTVVTGADGAEAEPVLVAWALLALAAVAGVLATATWGRRLIGALLALAGGLAVVRSVAGLSTPGTPSPEALPVTARSPGALVAVDVGTLAPLLAALGALLMTAVGVLVAWRAATLPRLGARYERSSADAASGRPVDPDKELWEALDAGRDPTAEASTERSVASDAPVRRDSGGDSTMDAGTADGVGRS